LLSEETALIHPVATAPGTVPADEPVPNAPGAVPQAQPKIKIHSVSEKITRELSLEEYLAGVQASESSVENEIEALKAQDIRQPRIRVEEPRAARA
jgi:peptidoglycan hydrolase-like amidase